MIIICLIYLKRNQAKFTLSFQCFRALYCFMINMPWA